MATERINNILIGPARVFLADPNIDLPHETTVAYGDDWPADWDPLGLLMDGSGVQMRHSLTRKQVRADGIILPVKSVPTQREIAFAFSLLEYTPENLEYVFGDSVLTTTPAGGGQKAWKQLVVGGGQDCDSYCVGMEAFRKDSAGNKQPVRWRLYEGTVDPDGETPFQQGSESALPLVCMALYNDDAGQVAELQYVTAPST